MKKKGIGWIPDYPDIHDYTLENKEIKNLTSRIQSQGDTASIEDLAQKVYDILGILADKQKDEKLTQLQEELEKDILSDFYFVNVELHKILRPEMADPEVLLIKDYLRRIIQTWEKYSKSVKYQPVITDTTFDSITHEILKIIIADQKQLYNDGCVGKDDMEVLKQLAELASYIEINESKDINFFRDWTQKWQEYLKQSKSNKINQFEFDELLINLLINLFELADELFNFFIYLYDYDVCNYSGYQSSNYSSYTKSVDTKESDNIKRILECINNLQKVQKKINQNDSNSFKIEFSHILTKKINEVKKIIQDEDIEIKIQTKDDFVVIYDKIYESYKFFKNIVKEVYKFYPPQIPPQLLKTKRIELPIITPIPNPVFELLAQSVLNQKTLETEYSQLQPNQNSLREFLKLLQEQDKPVQQLTESMIEMLAQMLMPLGQYSNLSETVDRVLKKIFDFLEAEPAEVNRRNLIRETIEEYNLGRIKDFIFIEELDFQKNILQSLQLFTNEIQSKNGEEKFLQKTKIFSEKFQNIFELLQSKTFSSFITNTENEPSYVSQSEYRKTKTPLFEISNGELKRLRVINQQNNSVHANNNSSQSIKNILQFPIGQNLRTLIKKELDNQEDEKLFLSLPEFVDLSYWCSPIEDQRSLNSCTAHAAIALIEYAEKKSSGVYIDASPLFLYKVTRNLMQREGDSGASVRDTMKTMVAFGVCPEQYWTYNEDKFDEEPTSFCYSFAENYKTLKYFRLDYGQISRYTLLSQVKVLLASEFPCIFGFTLYNSVYDEVNVLKGHIPLPNAQDKVLGGHTVVAVGYHDRKVITNSDGKQTNGALLIRNSWGTEWGQGGYGWLPYDYIIDGLTADWWSLIKAEWLATGRFGAGASAWNADKGDPIGNRGKGQ